MPRYNRGDVRSFAKSWASWFLPLVLTGSGVSLAAGNQNPSTIDLPSRISSTAVSGWVLTDFDGDRNADLATARSASHTASGYSQEVRVTLGSLRQSSFRFVSSGATVELSSRDVDGDNDRDLVVFESLSSQPIGVWLNDGAGSFHEGRLADFRKLWSEQPGPAWRARAGHHALFAVSPERTQSLVSLAAATAPELTAGRLARHKEPARREPRSSDFRPRAPPRNS